MNNVHLFPSRTTATSPAPTGEASQPSPLYSMPTDEFDELNLGAWFFTILVAVFPFIILGGMALGYLIFL